MRVFAPNDVKIYDLSCGKSLPEWLSDRKRRAMMKKNVDIRKRIELIQDFQMPGLSTNIRISPDGQYIMATGIYKPRVRCFDVHNLAMKFERCFDSEVITFEILSEDYSKMVFLQCDRYIEIHSAEGRYYRLRMPKFGHDMKYHYPSCDLYLVGSSCDIYRLNLERGQYNTPVTSKVSSKINKVAINKEHGLVITGGQEGKVEAWDPRCASSIGILDCAMNCLTDQSSLLVNIPYISSLEFDGPLNVGVGMSTGQILLYDIRSNKPFTVKDHMYDLPIKNISFLGENVLSMDSCIVKIWNRDTGKLFTSIQAGAESDFNDLCVVPNSGMMFIANENVKIQTYYIPSLGPAPKWCGFLDALTEELEENTKETVYDDYKFVTEKQLEELGLSHLIGSNLLRAYMHGYFMDIRLYRKAKSAVEPFEFDQYKKKVIQEKLDSVRKNRVQKQTILPAVNKELAVKLMIDEKDNKNKNKKRKGGDLLHDERFKAIFENPEYEIDTNAEEYKLLNPVLKRLDKKRSDVRKLLTNDVFHEIDDEREGKASSDEESSEWDESSDEEGNSALGRELQQQHREAKVERLKRERAEKERRKEEAANEHKTKFYELTDEHRGSAWLGKSKSDASEQWINNMQKPLGSRVEQESKEAVQVLSYGNKSLSYTPNESKKNRRYELEMKKHRIERKQVIRPGPKHLRKPKFFFGPKPKRTS